MYVKIEYVKKGIDLFKNHWITKGRSIGHFDFILII